MKNGGPAFPTKPPLYRQTAGEAVMLMEGESGMSLRDYFAAAALTGILSMGPANAMSSADFANLAYGLADKMLEVRAPAA